MVERLAHNEKVSRSVLLGSTKEQKMKDEYYRQCRLKRENSETVGYIPERAAKVGNKVELLSLDSLFWTVTEVGTKVDYNFVKENERNYRLFQESLKGGGID